MQYGMGLHPMTDDDILTDVGRMYSNITNVDGCSYVKCKEDLEYDDLCTLESLLSYFNHDIALDMEIAQLKEVKLLTTIQNLEAKVFKHEMEAAAPDMEDV